MPENMGPAMTSRRPAGRGEATGFMGMATAYAAMVCTEMGLGTRIGAHVHNLGAAQPSVVDGDLLRFHVDRDLGLFTLVIEIELVFDTTVV